MIDIHSHILHDIDDGATTLEESVRMLKKAKEIGIGTIIATPHYQESLYETGEIGGHFEELAREAEKIGIVLKLGREVFINPFLPDLLKKDRSLTLNQSRYLLLELPYDAIPIYTYETIFKLQLMKILPVLAHPERNMNILRSFVELGRFLERGCLIQVEAGSLVGVYGRQVEEFAEKLIKLNLAHFIASDAHFESDYDNWYLQAYKKVKKIAGEEYAGKLFEHNAQIVLDDVQESIYDLI